MPCQIWTCTIELEPDSIADNVESQPKTTSLFGNPYQERVMMPF